MGAPHSSKVRDHERRLYREECIKAKAWFDTLNRAYDKERSQQVILRKIAELEEELRQLNK